MCSVVAYNDSIRIVSSWFLVVSIKYAHVIEHGILKFKVQRTRNSNRDVELYIYVRESCDVLKLSSSVVL